ARLGLGNAALKLGDAVKADTEAGVVLAGAQATGDPYLQALAWELKARIELFRNQEQAAAALIGKALAIVEKQEVPIAGWRIHSAAWEIFTRTHDLARAAENRERARGDVMALANSLHDQEPLRRSFLKAPAIQAILGAKS